MSVKLNSKGNSNAKSLVRSGKVDKTSAWSFSAGDGNKLLGADGDDWSNYGKWHLAVDTSAEADTKAHYKYPFGKNGKVYRSALRAIRSRAAQQGVTDVFDAAGRLMDAMGDEEDSASPDIERRFLQVENLEVREAKDDEGPKIVGYAARFNKLSDDLGGFREKIAPGAFKKTIKEDDIRGLFNHDSNFVLGRTSAGTLNLYEDKKGLRMEIDPPDAEWAKGLMASIRRRDITEQSFGFNALQQEWDERDEQKIVRTLKEVKLFDVGPVTYAAYPQTTVQVRSLEKAFSATGIDTQKISRALLKVEHGLEITEDDRRAIDEVIEQLRSIAPPREDEQGDEHDQQPTHRVALMRRRLELKLKSSDHKEVNDD